MHPLSILLIFFNPLFKTITTYDYASAYSVMKIGGPWDIFMNFVNNYGYLIFALMVLGVIGGIQKKETRFLSVMNIIIVLFAYIQFNQVQIFGTHHYYIINVCCIIFCILGICFIYEHVKIKAANIIFLCTSILIVFNFQKTLLLKNITDVYQVTDTLISSPLPDLRISKDTQKIRKLALFLDETPQEYEYVYVLSNSVLFNDDMLRNAFLPDKLEGVKNLLTASAYDTRDGIPSSFWQYYYIVVADPIQLQFEADKQRCVSVLAEFFLKDSRVSDYYKTIQTIELDNDVTLYVYQRIEQVPNSIRQEVSNTLKGYYPDDPKMYQFDMLSE